MIKCGTRHTLNAARDSWEHTLIAWFKKKILGNVLFNYSLKVSRTPFNYTSIAFRHTRRKSLSLNKKLLMAPSTKRQKQVHNLPRKKGRYCRQEVQQITPELLPVTATEFLTEIPDEEIIQTGEWAEEEIIQTEEWTEEELVELEEVKKRFINEALKWHKTAASHLRPVYTKTSRTTIWRQKSEEKKLKEHVKGIKKIDSFFRPVSEDISVSTSASASTLTTALTSTFSSLQPSPETTFFSSQNLRARLEELNQKCSIGKSIKANHENSTYDYLRLLSIRQFLQLLLDGEGKIDASNQIAQTTWNKGNYVAKCIRRWGSHFVKTGELLVHRQGKHTKLESLVDDEDFSEDCKAWLRQQKPETRSPSDLKAYIEETLFPKRTGHIKKDTISEITCRRYMHSWGYKYNERRKDIYFDGHERPDVVAYRKEWLKRMFVYKKNMKDFDGDMFDVILEPQLESGEREFIQVTHDECHVYANDGRQRIWVQEGENALRPKHMGRSIMVSAFLCPCHGLLRLSEQQLHENPHIEDKEAFVLRSVQTDGYWKSEHMLDQLVHKAIPIFEVLHPGCTGVFCFDQSTNHNAMAEDALIVRRMNLSPGGAQPKMRNGWYIDESGEKHVQSMIFPNDYSVEQLRERPKGIKQVLVERNLWPTKKIRLMCEKCSEKCADELDCCAQRIMSLQPDFLEQRSLLEEAVIGAGHIFERYPKFHCECNFIERYWGFVKRETRKLCSYSYADLVNRLPQVLNNVPTTIIRKFARKSWRYMDAYDKGLEGQAAEWAVNKYKSHRRIPENIERLIEMDKVRGNEASETNH